MSKTKNAAFRLVIEKQVADPNKLSKTIKGFIRDYEAVEKGIEALQEQKAANNGELDEDDQRELDAFIEDLEAKDKDLVKRINNWISNEAINIERGKKLSEGKAKKKIEQENIAKGLNADGSTKTTETPNETDPAPGGGDTPPSQVPPGGGNDNPAPVKKAEGAADELPVTPTEEVPVEEDPKKEKSFWGWVAAVVIVGIGIAVGVKLNNRN